MKTNSQTQPATAPPWWKFGHVWLVIAGPAIVVVAGFVTAFIAVNNPDPVLTGDYFKRADTRIKTVQPALAPALQGRNHAATVPAGSAPGSAP
ncbi:FixH family protein [Caenimonas sp. SL110]|uniref:FixH family protein n=1 Tax=Caenimonas sp. SL110 TaxID=1450524 RepID=UPI0006540C81|nr:FixH family protein [Caenimonas sp. SL110]